MPTEAEWEYAARGTRFDFFSAWGNETARCPAIMMTDQFEADGTPITACGHNKPPPVLAGVADISPFDVRDMGSSVMEWVADWYAEDYYEKSPNQDPKGPSGPAEFDEKVTRGAGYNCADPNCYNVSRRFGAPRNTGDRVSGFRCAKDAD